MKRMLIGILIAVSIVFMTAGISYAGRDYEDEEDCIAGRTREVKTVRVPIEGPVYHTILPKDRNRPLTILEQRMVNTAPQAEKGRIEEMLRAEVIHPTACAYHGKHGVPNEGCKKCGVYPHNTLALRSELYNGIEQAWQGPKRFEGYVEMPVFERKEKERCEPAPVTNITNNWNFGGQQLMPVSQALNTMLPGFQKSETWLSVNLVPVPENTFKFAQITDIDFSIIMQQWQQMMQQNGTWITK